MISFTFYIKANDKKAEGDVVLLYDNLKIKLLKNSEQGIKNKSLNSFIANILIKNQNPSNGNLRTGKIEFNRVMTKSFFNIVWKSLFDGFKKSLRQKIKCIKNAAIIFAAGCPFLCRCYQRDLL